MDQNVPDIVAQYGPYETSAAQLLHAASNLVPSGTALSPEHILLAALPDPSTGALNFQGSTFQWLRTTEERQQLQRLRRSLNREIAAPSPDGASDLIRCAAHWHDEAGRRGVLITDNVVIWSILDDDNNRASELLDLAFDIEAQKRHLAAQFHSASGTESAGVLPTPDVEKYLDRVEPTKGFHYAAEFDNFREDVVEKVERCEAPGFVVAYGERGSPLRALKHMLADAIADTSQPREALGRFGSCHQACSLSLVSLCKLPAGQAKDLLDNAITRSSVAEQALILDHMEELRRHASDAYAPAVAALTERLGRHMNAVVVGQYWLNRDESDNLDALDLPTVLDLPDLAALPAQPYTMAHTENALRTHFVAGWERDGFTFNDDSFVGLELLEPAIEEKGEHPKLLPFLAIDAVQSVVDILKRRRGSETHVKRWVSNTAQDALDKLTMIGKATAPSTRVHDYFAAEFMRARQQAERLKAQPDLPRRRLPASSDEASVLTREVLVIALLADVDIRFVYPTEEKLNAILARQPAMPPWPTDASGDSGPVPLVPFRTPRDGKNAVRGGGRDG